MWHVAAGLHMGSSAIAGVLRELLENLATEVILSMLHLGTHNYLNKLFNIVSLSGQIRRAS